MILILINPKNQFKLFDLKRFVLTILIVISSILQGAAQTEQPFTDPQLEGILKKNQIKEANVFIKDVLVREDQLTLEQKVYYLNRKSHLELLQGTFSESLASAKRSEKLLDSAPKSLLWGETFRAVCYAYIRIGKLDSALLYAEKLFVFSKKENDPKLGRAALVALGNISLQNKSYQKSLDFYLEALNQTQESNDSINLRVDLYNAGLAYARLNQTQKSNELILKAAKLAESEQALDLLARCYGSLADNYLSQNNYNQQEEYLEKANKIAEKIGNRQLLAMGYANLTEAKLRKKDYKNAVFTGKKSLTELQSIPLVQVQAKVDSMLYVAYKNLGDFKNALIQLEAYDLTRLKIRNEAQKEKLDKLTLQFEVEKKDLVIQNQTTSLEKEKAKNRLLVIGIASVTMLGFFLSYINVKNAKTRKVLFRKEKELDLQITHFRPLIFDESKKEISDIENELVDGSDHKKLFGEILQFIQERKLYLNPKFNQQSLVSEFGTNRQYLYEAISKNGDENFRGLINRFRINEAKEIIGQMTETSESLDFANLSEKVGFNSYATFYRAFKNLTGLTPNEFTKELKKELKEKV